MPADPFTPEFYRRLQQLKIRTRRAFLGSRQGSHRSLRKGHGLEFADFRQYAPGDDFRHIDWGVLARTDRVYVREFREEQDLNVVVILDASASMAYPEGAGGRSEKFDFARYLALSLGYIALTNGDTVTFSVLGQRNSPRYSGPRALHRARKLLMEVEPAGSFDLLTETRAAIARQRIPGKCFFISDFLAPTEEIFAAFDCLRSHNFELCAVQVLSPAELRLDPALAPMAVDAETGASIELSLDGASVKEYALLLAEHVDVLERYAQRAGMTYVLLSSDDNVADAVLSKLTGAGILN